MCEPNMATIGGDRFEVVRTWTRTKRLARAKHWLSGWTVSVGSTHTMSVEGVIWRPGMRPRWVLMTAVVLAFVPRSLVAPNGWTIGHATDLAGRLGRSVHRVDAAPEVEDRHQDDEERDDGERELDEGLAALSALGDPAHGFEMGYARCSSSVGPVVQRDQGRRPRCTTCDPGSGPGSCSSACPW